MSARRALPSIDIDRSIEETIDRVVYRVLAEMLGTSSGLADPASLAAMEGIVRNALDVERPVLRRAFQSEARLVSLRMVRSRMPSDAEREFVALVEAKTPPPWLTSAHPQAADLLRDALNPKPRHDRKPARFLHLRNGLLAAMAAMPRDSPERHALQHVYKVASQRSARLSEIVERFVNISVLAPRRMPTGRVLPNMLR